MKAELIHLRPLTNTLGGRDYMYLANKTDYDLFDHWTDANDIAVDLNRDAIDSGQDDRWIVVLVKGA